jgi:hypothetical protein
VCSDAADPPDIDLKSQYVAAVLINSDASISLNYRLNSRVSDMDGPKPENNGTGADSPISGRLLGAPPDIDLKPQDGSVYPGGVMLISDLFVISYSE